MRIFVIVLAFAVAASVSAAPKGPDKLGKTAARKFASAMVNTCNETDDVLACLEDQGSECSTAGESDEPAYRCVYDMQVSATKVRHSDSAPREWEFQVTFLVKNGRKGLRARTESIREVKD